MSAWQWFLRLGLGGALAWIASCSVLPQAETIEVYQLPSSSIAEPKYGDALPWTLRVSIPGRGRLGDTQRVLVLNPDNRIIAYKGARWSDSISILMRNRLTNAFRADGRLAAISHDNANLTPDLELDGELGAFQVEYIDGIPTVVIRVYTTLIQPLRYKTVASRGFEVTQPVKGKGMPSVVSAFGKAADRLAGEIVDWTVEQSGVLQSQAR